MDDRFWECVSTPVSELKGIGEKSVEKLSALSIFTVRDLLFHLPRRYEDRATIVPCAEFTPGIKSRMVGTIVDSQIKYGRKRSLLLTVKDDSGVISVRIFGFSSGHLEHLFKGAMVSCYGEIRPGQYGPEMSNPECERVGRDATVDTYTPVYGLTKGITAGVMRTFVRRALALLDECNVSLPPCVLDEESDIPLLDAIKQVHAPPVDGHIERLNAGTHRLQQRLIKEELLAYSLSVLRLKVANFSHRATSFPPSERHRPAFLDTLPFSPTGAQQRVVKEIDDDLKSHRPMMRLVQGDVGSGKTLVAALSALNVIEKGAQVALMAPTEILSEQHANTFSEWLTPLGLRVGWLSGKMRKKARNAVLEQLRAGEIDLIVGTHALFQKEVEFKQLGLLIIDEQHRFGVHQRLELREKGCVDGIYPHQLVMTATPIPRTLAMVAYAELNTSVIDELPPGRTPVKTVAIPDHRRDDVIKRIMTVCDSEKRQVYWVCTLIEESEVLGSQAVSETHASLTAALPSLRVGMVHGKMKAEEKQAVMQAFSDGDVDVLVATTVIEVGVNVPNASLMIIENPERLGLSQLHQLRGRVGRGEAASSCVLMYGTPMSAVSKSRLAVMRETNDGFVVAERDLELRGGGELLGTRQTGVANLRIADIERDAALIPVLNETAMSLWESDPEQASSLVSRWGFDVEQYGNV